MTVDYAAIAAEVAGALEEVNQGTVVLKRVTVSPPPNDYTEGAETVETWPLKATVKRMHQRYENGVLIVETGDMVTFATLDTVPLITDLITIDGRDRAITNLTPIPGAGTPVMWKAWCGA
ncbi:hypothetical protein [Stappia sp.]|uniref:hypothetical protein n=1 Tax=Stappia sp. TaxID=1870903 RepID=UPI003C7DEA2C